MSKAEAIEYLDECIERAKNILNRKLSTEEKEAVERTKAYIHKMKDEVEVRNELPEFPELEKGYTNPNTREYWEAHNIFYIRNCAKKKLIA